MFDLPKFCSDTLRNHASQSSVKLKPSHAHELVAAFFGYKSHAALLHEPAYPVSNLDGAKILVPELQLMEARRYQLKELPEDLPGTVDLAQVIISALQDEGHFTGDVWLYETLESYIADVFLFKIDSQIMDELSGEMAVTNANFGGDYPDYDELVVTDEGQQIVFSVDGVYEGENHEDKPFYGDTIDFQVMITLPRLAGRVGFGDYVLEVTGGLRDDW